MSAEELAGLGLDERVGMGGRDRGVSLVVPEDYMPGRTISVATPDGEMGEVELPKDAKPGQTVNLTMKKFDASGDEVVELVRPTPETKLGLTFGEFCGQVVIHQVFPGYPAEKLKAGDFVHAINGTPVTAEKTATHIASKTGDRLLLKLRAPPGSTAVEFEKPDPDTEVGIDLMFDKPSGRVRIEAIRDGTPAKTCEGLAVGDVLLAVNGDRARVGIVGQLRTWRSRGQGRASLRALKRARNSRPQLLRTHMATALPSRAKGAPRFARWRESPSLRPRGEWEE